MFCIHRTGVHSVVQTLWYRSEFGSNSAFSTDTGPREPEQEPDLTYKPISRGVSWYLEIGRFLPHFEMGKDMVGVFKPGWSQQHSKLPVPCVPTWPKILLLFPLFHIPYAKKQNISHFKWSDRDALTVSQLCWALVLGLFSFVCLHRKSLSFLHLCNVLHLCKQPTAPSGASVSAQW